MRALFKHITDVLFFDITNLWKEELFLSHFASKEKGPRAAKPLVPGHTWKGLGFGSEISGWVLREGKAGPKSLRKDKQGQRKLARGAKLCVHSLALQQCNEQLSACEGLGEGRERDGELFI